ncbi:MAG: TonB-dependent receptor [Chlorobi bacterium]|nr:TonB-dependent receptor [Chlorobiota bacterium]
MKGFTVFILSLLLSFHVLHAQDEAWIKGTVSDSLTGQPLPGASVSVSRSIGVMSGPEGKYEISLKPGAYLLQVRYLGYHSKKYFTEIKRGDTLVLHFALSPANAMLNEIVVSAEKFEQKISDVNLSMAVLKPARIVESNALSLDEVLNQLSGIEILDGQPSIRGGSGFSYGAGSRVLVVVDGLPLMSGDAGDVKWNFLPMDNLKQVEIMKGASSVLYGSSALNGVINLRTMDPGNHPETSIRIFSGAYLKPARHELIWYDTPRWYAGAGLNDARKKGRFDLVSGINVYENKGYREDEYEKRIRTNFNLRYHPQKLPGWYFGMNINGMLVNSSDFFLWQNADSGAYRQNPAGVVPLNGYRLTLDPYLTFHSEKGGVHTLKTRLFANKNNMPQNPEKNNRFDLFLGEYRYNKPVTSNLRLTLGASENYSRVHSELYGDHNRNEMAIFGQMNGSIGNKLKGTLGVRWENYKLDHNWTLAKPVFRAGVNYKLYPFSHFRISFGQGYRYPSIAEKYTATQLGALRIFPNPGIVPETGWSTEIGFIQGFQFGTWKGSVDLAVYRNEYQQMIEFAFGLYLPDSVSIPSLDYVGFKALNVGKARITGSEILLNLTKEAGAFGFDFQGGYNYNNPVDLNIPGNDSVNNILKYRFRHSVKGNMNLSYKHWLTGATLVYNSFMERVDSVFIDPVFGNAIMPGYPEYRNKHQKGYAVIDWRFTYRFLHAARLSVTVKNLFNVEYMGRPGDIRPQRSITLQYTMKF